MFIGLIEVGVSLAQSLIDFVKMDPDISEVVEALEEILNSPFNDSNTPSFPNDNNFPDTNNDSPNTPEQTGGGNSQPTGVEGLPPGMTYNVSGYIIVSAGNYKYNQVLLQNKKISFSANNITTPFSGPTIVYLSETSFTISVRFFHADGYIHITGGMLGSFENDPYYIIHDVVLNITTPDGEEVDPSGDGFNPTPNPTPTPDDGDNPIPDLEPEVPPTPDSPPNPNDDPGGGDSPSPEIIYVPEPYVVEVPEIIYVPEFIPYPEYTEPEVQIIYVPEPYVVEVPIGGEGGNDPNNPSPDEDNDEPTDTTPTPPVPPTECNPCLINDCDNTEILDALELLQELYEQLKEQLENDLECHEDSFKSIINNQKTDRKLGLTTMAFSVHNSMMLSDDVSSTIQYPMLVPSTAETTSISGYCGNNDSINYNSFINEISSKVGIQQNLANSASSWLSASLIIRTSANIWRFMATNTESLRQYILRLISSISVIGNALKQSKVVQDNHLDFLSSASDAITQEQLAYDLGLIPGSPDGNELSSVSAVLNPLNADIETWQAFQFNLETLNQSSDNQVNNLIADWEVMEGELETGFNYPDSLQPEMQD